MECVHEKWQHKSNLPHVDVVYEAASLEVFLRLLTNELSLGCTFEHGMPIVSHLPLACTVPWGFNRETDI